MNEESKAIAAERMRRYWDEVRSGKRQHKSRGRVKATPEPEPRPSPETVYVAPKPEPAPVVQPPKKEAISPIAKAEHIHFPMPGVKPEISFMLDPQQPVEHKHVTETKQAFKEALKPILKEVDDALKSGKIKFEKNTHQTDQSPKVNLVVGRRVKIPVQHRQDAPKQKVIMQFGRRARNPGDL